MEFMSCEEAGELARVICKRMKETDSERERARFLACCIGVVMTNALAL